MDESILQAAQRAIGHTFADTAILERALTHASAADSRLASNERMEFLGDSVLGLVIARRLYERFPDLLEGELTKIKSTAVSRQTCSAIARQLGLEELMVLGKGMRRKDGLPHSLSAAVLESVIAAVYLDGGFAAAERFVATLFEPLIEKAAASGHQENFKSVLQQVSQQKGQPAPVYRILDEKGPDHSKAFKICVDIGGKRFEPTWGQTKKQAEQIAALNALREMGLAIENPDGSVTVIAPPAIDAAGPGDVPA